MVSVGRVSCSRSQVRGASYRGRPEADPGAMDYPTVRTAPSYAMSVWRMQSLSGICEACLATLLA